MGKSDSIWLIGAGIMAQDYIKVLKHLDLSFEVIGKSKKSAFECEKNTNCSVYVGGLKKFLAKKPTKCTHAIIAVSVENLFETTQILLNYGIKNILVEKPGALFKNEFEDLNNLAKKLNSNIFIAYNRRFYASVIKAKEIIEKDGGITSFNFEFTEWAHIVEKLNKPKEVLDKWFLANSTHVVDLAFFLGGYPKKISTFTKGSLSWHTSASIFSGSGISKKGALFNYQANWESAGRWSVEILTKKHRLILKPIEKLMIQKKGEIAQIFDDSVDYTIDQEYKPGLYIQTKKFLENDFIDMCTIQEQNNIVPIYYKIADYFND